MWLTRVGSPRLESKFTGAGVAAHSVGTDSVGTTVGPGKTEGDEILVIMMDRLGMNDKDNHY